ncbi:hypothetical protein ACGFYQ_33930 [Streptomyces sp. NPDC048258]|uniref:hypothetical protein n=1 Tax=Streptomyces sp. NPDC048258 TaxID=3365527 RepID=UPI0037125832
MTVRTRVRRPRGLRLGPLWLWARRIPSGPNLAYGRIAVTDTPHRPRGGRAVARDGHGWVLVVGSTAFALLRCRSVPLAR